ncbi:MAG TPA: hypothetical protein VFC39_06825 [Acidobacteriaceae bacterium]|nr:hypothetical protein [Acidobacteriaceae bacterium]
MQSQEKNGIVAHDFFVIAALRIDDAAFGVECVSERSVVSGTYTTAFACFE